jgi:hypothetical protein
MYRYYVSHFSCVLSAPPSCSSHGNSLDGRVTQVIPGFLALSLLHFQFSTSSFLRGQVSFSLVPRRTVEMSAAIASRLTWTPCQSH